MNKLKLPKDEENICLRCKYRYMGGFRHMPIYCGCQLGSMREVNVGHRKNCKYFSEEGGEK